MTSARRIRWIDSELDGLVEAGVLAPDTADRVRAHYRGAARARPAGALFAVLGGALVGLGTILLLAHNWEGLPRGVRAAISLGWLVSGQALAAFALWRRAGSTGWVEAGGLFASISVAGCLALLSQTYQIPGSLDSFLATWAWLSLPLAYALDARATVALVIALAAAHLSVRVVHDDGTLPFWALLCAALPYLVSLARRPRVSPRDTLVAWIAAPVLIAGSVALVSLDSEFALVLFAFVVAAALYALGVRAPGVSTPAPFAATPARVVGGGTLAIGVLVLCHAAPWSILDDLGSGDLSFDLAPPVLLALLGAGAAAWRVRHLARCGEWARALWLGVPLAYAVAWAIGVVGESPSLAAWAMSLFALALGITTTLSGVAEASAARANGGMLLLGGVIALRFVDSDWSFTVRGLVFIVLGAGFLAFNLWLRRRGVRREGDR